MALVENGVPIIGVLHNPVTKETFYASKGNGAYLDDSIYKCSAKESTTDMVILNSRSETRRGLWEPYKQYFKELMPIGSVAYKMGLTAVGEADIFATLRPKNEGGEFIGSENERKSIIKLIAEYNPFLLDIEFNVLKKAYSICQ